jgi:hypothetical protein
VDSCEGSDGKHEPNEDVYPEGQSGEQEGVLVILLLLSVRVSSISDSCCWDRERSPGLYGLIGRKVLTKSSTIAVRKRPTTRKPRVQEQRRSVYFLSSVATGIWRGSITRYLYISIIINMDIPSTIK